MLSDIERRNAAGPLANGSNALFTFTIRSVETFTLADAMFVNADTLGALQILRSEAHPNMQGRGPDRSKTGAKESLSVYGLFHSLASSPQGKSKLRQIFFRPSINLSLIRERHETIAVLLRPENTEIMVSLTKALRRIKNIRTSLASLRRGVYLPPGRASMRRGVWPTLQHFVTYALEFLEIVRRIPREQDTAIISKVHPRSHLVLSRSII